MDEFRVLLKATFQSFPNTDKGLYQRLVNQFGGWVLKLLRQYSNSLLSHIIFAPFAVDVIIYSALFQILTRWSRWYVQVDEWEKLYDSDKKALRLLDCCDIMVRPDCSFCDFPRNSPRNLCKVLSFFLANERRRLYGALYICNVTGKKGQNYLENLQNCMASLSISFHTMTYCRKTHAKLSSKSMQQKPFKNCFRKCNETIIWESSLQTTSSQRYDLKPRAFEGTHRTADMDKEVLAMSDVVKKYLRMQIGQAVRPVLRYRVYSGQSRKHQLKSSLQWRAKLHYGFWNRRGDYLTEDGNMLHAP